MKRAMFLSLCGTILLVATPRTRADEILEKYQECVRKGLDYIAKHQNRDGSWSANGGQYPISVTALAGMALLMEGSTVTQGKYSENIRKAADYLIEKVQKGGNRDGLIGNPDNPLESYRYMYG